MLTGLALAALTSVSRDESAIMTRECVKELLILSYPIGEDG